MSWVYTLGRHATQQRHHGYGARRLPGLRAHVLERRFRRGSPAAYLTAHPGVEYLLGFNEPNIAWTAGGSSMTPQQAADAWPRLEKIADDYGLKLVAPALNFSGDNVGGTVTAARPTTGWRPSWRSTPRHAWTISACTATWTMPRP